MEYYLVDKVVDELPANMKIRDGNWLVDELMEVENPTKSFIALRDPNPKRARAYFEIRKNVEEKLLQDLGISSLKDLVGREFVGYGGTYNEHEPLEAISPARFDEEKDYTEAA